MRGFTHFFLNRRIELDINIFYKVPRQAESKSSAAILIGLDLGLICKKNYFYVLFIF